MLIKRHFSRMELIILIVIVVVLAVLWIPTIARSGSAAKTVSCAANLKQSANALVLYGSGNDNWICTYGDNWSAWYKQPGVPEALGFKVTTVTRPPVTQRPLTLCPDFWENSPTYNGVQGYGVAWFQLFPKDYEREKCEIIEQLSKSIGQFIQVGNIKRPSRYVLLADSAFTTTFKGEMMVPGLQSVLFTRRKEGFGSDLTRAIILRHKGEANIAYIDGHVGDTADRMGMLAKSKIGAYIDATARYPIVTK